MSAQMTLIIVITGLLGLYLMWRTYGALVSRVFMVRLMRDFEQCKVRTGDYPSHDKIVDAWTRREPRACTKSGYLDYSTGPGVLTAQYTFSFFIFHVVHSYVGGKVSTFIGWGEN